MNNDSSELLATIKLTRSERKWYHSLASYAPIGIAINGVPYGHWNIKDDLTLLVLPGRARIDLSLGGGIAALPFDLFLSPSEEITLFLSERYDVRPQFWLEASKPPNISIILSDKYEEVLSPSELIDISPGVIVKITRNRQIEQSIIMEAATTAKIGYELGFAKHIKSTIQAEVASKQGVVCKENEIIGCDITLDGNQSSKWLIHWKDIWRKGIIKLTNSAEIPFRYREKSELKVEKVS